MEHNNNRARVAHLGIIEALCKYSYIKNESSHAYPLSKNTSGPELIHKNDRAWIARDVRCVNAANRLLLLPVLPVFVLIRPFRRFDLNVQSSLHRPLRHRVGEFKDLKERCLSTVQ